MSISLLTTKFYFPPARASLVPRPRLIKRLVNGLRGPLTLISAPAGYGKTTLLSEWRAGDGGTVPVAWLSLESGDNDLRRFLQYLLAALDPLRPGIEAAARSLVQTAEHPDGEAVLTLTVNHFSCLVDDSVLVLDDYHQIEDPTIHASLTFLLEHIPPCLHLILLTRSDPPLPLARLRSRGRLTEIRADDLRFNNEEARTFLNDLMGLNLSEQNVSALDKRTEGWIVGLQMAALSIQGKEDTTAFIETFTGSNRYILDYLTEEVLQQQAEAVQTFLLHTSILDRFSGSLCDAVLGGVNDSDQLLMELERKNLFLIPLDDERQWYRYHHLFSELLFRRLKKTGPELLNELYMRAAAWLEANGYLENAVGYALRAKNYELATRLIDQIKNDLWGRGEVRPLLNWFNTLPQELLRSQPELSLNYATCLTMIGFFDAAKEWLQFAEDLYGPMAAYDQHAALRSLMIPIYRSIYARFHGDFSTAAALCQDAIDRLPDTAELRLRYLGVAHLFLGHAYFYAGDTDPAEQVLSDAIQYNLASGHQQAYLNSCHNLAQLRILQGRLQEARTIYEQAARTIKDQASPAFAGAEHACLGDLYREWNQMEAAAIEIQKGIELAEAGEHIFFLTDGYLAGVRLALSQKDWETASAYLQKAGRVTSRCPSSLENELLHTWQARLQLARGDLAGAAQWAESMETEMGSWEMNGPFDPQQEFELLTLARTWLAQGKTDQASDLLERIHTMAAGSKRYGRALEAQMLLALVDQAAGKEMQAVERLSRVLAHSKPEGYIRQFLDEGESMVQLLSKLATRTSPDIRDYAERLLAAYYLDHPQGQPQLVKTLHGETLIEPLSERELEVLQLISRGCSNKEIAADLFIAIGTVKRHTANIFSKLDVKNRTEAVARARELNLLPVI